MFASPLKTTFLVAALAGVGGSGMQGPAAPQPVAAAPAPDTGIAAALAEWRSVSDTSQLTFDSYAHFLLAHPGWPGEAAIRRAAEAQAGAAAPGAAIQYFRAFPPQTGSGRVVFARALIAGGDRARSIEAARSAWRGGALSPADESYVLTTFGGELAQSDHAARADALLWAGQTGAAARVLPLVASERRGVLTARLALRSNAADASDVAATTQALYGGDAGYVADRATWLRTNGAGPSARAWLAQPRRLTSVPGDPARWLELLLTVARGAVAEGQWQTVYDIGRQVDQAYAPETDVTSKTYAERDAYTDLAWLAAQAALKLGRPADAMTLFDLYGHGSSTPSVRSKGAYWAARSAERAGLRVDAARLWAATAAFRDQYYGQLAAEHLGRPLTAPPPMTAQRVEPLMRLAFGQRDMVRAARFLGAAGLYEDQTVFLRQIALDAKSDTDHLLAADLARELQRPDLGVMIGRSALVNGLSDYSAAGFPTVAVPSGYEGDWTIIHAVARQESQFNRTAISRAGARGLMQLMPGTAHEIAGQIGISYRPDELTSNPDLSMKLGASYFRRVYALYGSYPMAIAAYNAGPGNVNRWLRANGDPRTGTVDMVDWVEAIPIQETRNYVQRVLENAVVYDLMRPDRAVSHGPANLSWYLGRRPG
ncbi:lytic transglycosylase domain-containing protein [Sphingomonas sp.]|uniref:lytic transglycosylase domain-containing protein n=1 Tax=Sphingomonas sp. TaxID=28214 RepID=UPI003CC51AEC